MESKPPDIFFFEIENKVTDVGLRRSIAREVPDELEIRIDNLSSNKVRVFVKGKEAAVKKFYSLLKTKKLGHAEKYTFSEIQPVTAVGCFSVNTDRFFHKLQCEQLGKFVETGIDMQVNIRSMDKNVIGMQGSIESMDKNVKDMKESMDNLTKAVESLPAALAKALKESK